METALSKRLPLSGVPQNPSLGYSAAQPRDRRESGAIADLQLVTPGDVAERPARSERHGTQVGERHGRRTGSLHLDHRGDVLLEVLQKSVHQHEHRELRHRPRGGHHDPQVAAGAVAVGGDLAGVGVAGDDLVVERGAQLGSFGLCGVGNLARLRAERVGEALQVVRELHDAARDVSHGHTGQSAPRVDGEPEGDIRALDRDLVALGQPGHNVASLSSCVAWTGNAPRRFSTAEQPYQNTLKLLFCQCLP